MRVDCIIILDEEEPPDGDDDSIMDEIEQQEGKIGAKKLRKLQEKAEKKRQREVCLPFTCKLKKKHLG